jgi:hypothetical protein
VKKLLGLIGESELAQMLAFGVSGKEFHVPQYQDF